MPRCFKKGNAANCSLTERLAASRRYGIVRREKYKARPAALTTTFTTFGLSYSVGVPDAGGGGGHFGIGQGAGHGIDHRRINQRFVTLNIHHGIAGKTGGHFRDAIRTARMIRTGHLHAAKFGDLRNSRVVGRDNDFREGSGLLAAFDHVLNQWLPAMRASGFPGKRVDP